MPEGVPVIRAVAAPGPRREVGAAIIRVAALESFEAGTVGRVFRPHRIYNRCRETIVGDILGGQ